jgi:hypothetical protein
MGMENTELKALALVFIPAPGGHTLPQVFQFYNDGSAKLRGTMVDYVVEILRENGHMKVWAINQTGAPDSIWSRMFQRAGASRKVGSIMEVELKGA